MGKEVRVFRHIEGRNMPYQFLNLGLCRFVGLIGYLIEGDPFLGSYFSEDFYLQRAAASPGL